MSEIRLHTGALFKLSENCCLTLGSLELSSPVQILKFPYWLTVLTLAISLKLVFTVMYWKMLGKLIRVYCLIYISYPSGWYHICMANLFSVCRLKFAASLAMKPSVESSNNFLSTFLHLPFLPRLHRKCQVKWHRVS